MKTNFTTNCFYSLLLLLFFASKSYATNYYIATTGNDGNNGTAVGTPKLTLANIFSTYNLASGDVINIAAGTYTEDHIFVGTDDEGFSIIGASAATTIYDGDNTDFWLYSSSLNSDNISISNLTIKDNGYSSTSAIHFHTDGQDNLSFSNLIFDNCGGGSGLGGAITLMGGTSASISGCTFKNCDGSTSGYGGAIFTANVTTLTISKCIFYNNSAQYGSAITLNPFDNVCNSTITNCLFYENYGNSASSKGAIYVLGSGGTGATTTITNCTLADNTVSGGYAGIVSDGGGTVTVKNTISYNNATYDFYQVAGSVLNLTNCSYGSSGTISVTGNTSGVTGSPSFTNSATDDYSILSTSNCKNAGTSTGAPADDILGVSRSTVDIGCYEYVQVTLAADYYRSRVTGNWQTASNWQSSPDNATWMTATLVPTNAAISIDIRTGHTITVNGASTGSVVTVSGTGILTHSADLTISTSLTTSSTSTVNVNTSTLTVNGSSTIGGAMTISTGTYEANGAFDATGGSVTFTGAGNLNLGGAVTSLGTFTKSTSTVAYDYAGAQAVDADDYYNLTFTSAGTKTSSGTTTVGNTLTVNTTAIYDIAATTVTVTGDATIVGTANISTGSLFVDGTFNTSGSLTFSGAGVLDLDGTVTSLGTFTESTSTVVYGAAGAQSIDSDTYYNLEIDGSGTKTLAGTIDVNGNLSITAGTLASTSTYDITLAGNRTNNGTAFTHASREVTFDGGSAQTIGGSTATDFYDVNIANTSGNIDLAIDMTVEGTLTLTDGLLSVQGFTLTLGNTSTNGAISTAGDGTSYVVAYDDGATVGYMKQNVNSSATVTYEFPIGDGTYYTPLTLVLTGGTLSTADLTVYTKPEAIPNLNSASTNYIDRYWDVEPTGITSPTYDISYTYNTADINGSEVGMIPVKLSGTTWYCPSGSSFTTGTTQGTGSCTLGTNLLSWTGLSTFSLFGGVVNGAVSLPVELLSFTGVAKKNGNLLRWATAMEENNDYFTLEKTTDGVQFEIVGTINGAGNSCQQKDYSFTDPYCRKELNYYRLKQTDTDGKTKDFPVISIDNRESSVVQKEISIRTNLFGQEVNDLYRGMVIILYADGTTVKIVQ